MEFDRNTLISGAGIAVGAVALILALVTGNKVNNINRTLNFDTSVNVAVAEPEAKEQPDSLIRRNDEGVPVDEEGNPLSEEEVARLTAMEEATGSSANTTPASINIVMGDDSTVRLVDSTLRVPTPGNDLAKDLYVYLEGENLVRYDSSSQYLVVNNNMIIRAINAYDATYNGISEFLGSNGQSILIGERKVTDEYAIAVVYTVDETGMTQATADDVAKVQAVLNNAKANVSINSLSLFGTQVNPDWAENLVMTSKAVELMKGTQVVYIAPYVGSFGDGTTNTLVSGETSFQYSDNIKDASSGYTPYIYSFNADQNGMVRVSNGSNGVLTAKILAQSNMVIKDIYN